MENDQVLKPDESTLPNVHSEKIKEEFYKWFESRGLLAELRAYMRQLMVRALEENNKNGKKKWQKKSSTSPKLQAINLLVVDYLFHEDFFYTVSVFASEAHILDSLPQYSRYVTQSVQQRRWDPDSLPRFSRQETEDILDTLHLPPTPRQLRQAVDCYLAGRESLLACIVRTMVPVRDQSSGNGSMDEEEITPNHTLYSPSAVVEESCYNQQGCHQQGCYQLWSQEMQQLLLMAGLKLAQIHRMQHKWAQTIEVERQQARREAEEEFSVREAEWQRAVEERLREERSDLRERQSRVEVREQSLAALAEHLSAVHEDVTQRLSQLQLQNDQLDEQALKQEHERQRLKRKMKELKTYEENLNVTLYSQNESDLKEPLQTLNENITYNQSEQKNFTKKEAFVQVGSEEELCVTVSTQTLAAGAAASTQTLDVTVVASTQTVDTEDHKLQTSLDQPDPELVTQMEQARRKISELQEENLELRAHILQQRHRIDELTNRAANLSSQLEDSRVAVAVLSGQESAAVVASAPAPPPPPPLIAPTFGFRAPQRQGGGEESLFVPRPQQAPQRADGRRRPLRFAFSQQPSPTSGESSPTDEVIQNARRRINQLEQESVSIQRNFHDFHTRLFTADSLMFPPLRASRTSDSVMRVRRSDISGFVPPRVNYPPPSSNVNRIIHNRHQHEEQEESSGEFYDSFRIESLSNSRRLFNQKNIRHFERWKQFKKKFQKRDGSDHNRRTFRAPNSNTSSEDEDVDVRNHRRQDTNQTRRITNTQIDNRQVKQGNDVLDGIDLSVPKTNKDNKAANREKIPKVKVGQSEEMSTPEAPASNITSKIASSIEQAFHSPVAGPSKKRTQTEMDLEHSAKLIESVKILLEAQSIKESNDTTLSNGSLEVESLPRDSVNNSQIDVGITDTTGSIVTVQKINPIKDNEMGNMTHNQHNIAEQNTVFSQKPETINNSDTHFNSDFQETQLRNEHQQQSGNKKSSFRQSNANLSNPETSTIPRSNFESEVSNFAATSSDVAEVESGDRETTSFTSGSDILRELNPSKSDSSYSEISAGFGEDSKQSSDFWE